MPSSEFTELLSAFFRSCAARKERQELERWVEDLETRLTVAEAEAKVRGGEWCSQNRSAGRGPCGACAQCCKEATERAERAEFVLSVIAVSTGVTVDMTKLTPEEIRSHVCLNADTKELNSEKSVKGAQRENEAVHEECEQLKRRVEELERLREVGCGYGDPVPGKEAEELRSALEKMIESHKKPTYHALQRILDDVDARDALAYREEREELLVNARKAEAENNRLREERDWAQGELEQICGILAPYVPAIEECPDLGAYLDGHCDLDVPAALTPLLERMRALEDDLAAAAKDLPVPLPEPGTDLAKLLSANVLLRRRCETLETKSLLVRTLEHEADLREKARPAPVTRYHLQLGELFMSYHKHGDGNGRFWAPFDSPFLCAWDTPEEAQKHMVPGSLLRASWDGVLV